jgi:predicted peptidase
MLEISHFKTLDYVISYPDDYLPDKKYPLLIHLHGAGSRGNDINLIYETAVGPIGEINRGRKLPFIVVSPQCSVKMWFEISETTLAFIDEAASRPDVDRSRIYLCGISMGGYACWYFAMFRADLFAAILPVCGGGIPAFASYLKGLPVWAHHGALDDVVDVNETISMVKALKRIGSEVKMTIYPDRGHDCWTPVFANNDIYTWLLAHKKTNIDVSAKNDGMKSDIKFG